MTIASTHDRDDESDELALVGRAPREHPAHRLAVRACGRAAPRRGGIPAASASGPSSGFDGTARRDRSGSARADNFTHSVRRMTAVTTDPEIREEMIDTVRRFIAREVIPVASELEHADEYPGRDRRADEGARPVRDHDPGGVRRPRARPAHVHRRGRGARVRLDVAVGHRQHAHDRRVPRSSTTAPTSRSSDWLPAPRAGRAARLPLALGVRRGQRHAQHRVPGRARRRRVRRSTARRCGSPTASGPGSSRSRPAPTRASPASSSRRSPARRSAASR